MLFSFFLTGATMAQDEFKPLPPLGPQQRAFSKPDQVLQPKTDYRARLVTNKGTITVDLFEKQAPKTVNSFVFLALHRFYDGVLFHRVIPGFVAQTGDPTGTGSGGPGYQFGLEIDPALNFDAKGILGMARTSDPNSNGSQFFITLAPAPHLNGQYTVFGKVVDGMDVLDKINSTEGPTSTPDRLETVEILSRPAAS
jgi:cyclophilin family peptidyl-prolyl cis-trans isomerase